jgi:hypothetical protein
VQERLPFIVKSPVPQLLPVQPEKTDPAAGKALKATTLPAAKDSEQSPPQLIPAGLLVTVPLPVLVTVKVKLCTVDLAVPHCSGV